MPQDGSSSGRRVVFAVWRDTSHPEGGGSETYVERMAEHLATAGHRVTILCAAHGNSPADDTRRGVRYRRRGGRWSVYLHALGYLLGRGRNVDIVVDVQNGVPFFTPLIRGRRPVIVLVHHVHREQWSIVYPGMRGRIGWWLESSVAPRVYRRRQYVTVSDATAGELGQLGVDEDRIAVIGNGIDDAHRHPQASRAPSPTVCVLGRLVPHKQVEHALHAIASLADAIPDLCLDVIGEGWWRPELQARCAVLGITDRVTFHGHVPDGVRDQILDQAWLQLCPSVKEGWGIAIIEAAAHGVPTVAYRSAGGVTESVQDRVTGLIVDDQDGMTAATARLLLDADLRNRLAGAARARAASFDWRVSAEEFAKVIFDS